MWVLLAAIVAVSIALAAVTAARRDLLAKAQPMTPACCCRASCHDACQRKHA